MKASSAPDARGHAIRRGFAWSLAAMLLVAASGCASPRNPRDPLEPFNRKMMEFNDGLDAVILKPTATAYKQFVPPLMRTGVSNFFGNLTDLWSSVNSLLQFRVQEAAEGYLRFSVNTVMGLGGLLDIASELNLERRREDFGQTLGRWGVGAGPYIVLPLLGPSTLRDTLALPVDRRYDIIREKRETAVKGSLYVLSIVDKRSNLLRVGDVIEEAALDKYSFVRDAHLQRRRSEIFNSSDDGSDAGAGSDGNLPAEAPGTGAGQPPAAPAR